MTRPAEGDLAQAELDREYDCRATVPDYTVYLERRERLSAETRVRRRAIRDVRYGPSPDETLDVFPAEDGDGTVEIFVHGGYWRSGTKDGSSYLADAFAPHGVTTVVVNHSLAPRARLDEIVAQVRRAVLWVAEHAGTFGADRARIFVSGHSSGGHLVAMLLVREATGIAQLVRGACVMSGLFDLRPVQRSYVNGWLGLDPAGAERMSPLLHLTRVGTDLVVAVSGRDTMSFRGQSARYAGAWQAAGNTGRFLDVRGADHYSIVDELLEPSSALSRAVGDQLARERR